MTTLRVCGGFLYGQSKGTRVEENMLVKKRADIHTHAISHRRLPFLFQPPPPPPLPPAASTSTAAMARIERSTKMAHLFPFSD